jgi:hypothetical protein
MEFFLPSVIVLLLAAAVIFFVFPQFGPATLAIISAVLLAFGLYQHYITFGTEYRFSTWQLASFSPYFLVGGLLVVIAIFLLYTLPTGSSEAVPNVTMPTIANMPPANTSTNILTNTINNSLNTVGNIFNMNKKNNNNSILNNLGNYIPGFGNNSRNRGLNFPFSQV